MANARVSSCQAALAVARSVARAGQWRFLSCVLRAQLAGAARLGGWDSVRWQAGRQAEPDSFRVLLRSDYLLPLGLVWLG